MRRALLVDIDDTVVDWIGPAHDAVVASVATHPALVGHDPAGVARRFMQIVEETHELWLAGSMTVDELRAERIVRLVREAGTELAPAEARELSEGYRSAYLAARRPVSGAGALLGEARRRGARVVAVTNNLVDEQEAKLRATGLRDLFDALVVSEGVGVAKPDPRIFALALEAAGATADQAVMLGDSWENDVVGATRVGIAAVWLDRHGAGAPDPTLPIAVLGGLEPAAAVVDMLLGRAVAA